MDKIKNINNIFKSTLSIATRQVKAGELHSEKKSKTNRKLKSEKIPSTELKKTISEKLKLLDKNSENYTQQSNSIFLESVLIWEFGEEIINEPDFHQLLTKINKAINDNKESSSKFVELIKQLTMDDI